MPVFDNNLPRMQLTAWDKLVLYALIKLAWPHARWPGQRDNSNEVWFNTFRVFEKVTELVNYGTGQMVGALYGSDIGLPSRNVASCLCRFATLGIIAAGESTMYKLVGSVQNDELCNAVTREARTHGNFSDFNNRRISAAYNNILYRLAQSGFLLPRAAPMLAAAAETNLNSLETVYQQRVKQTLQEFN